MNREREREISLPVMAASRLANTKRMQIFILLPQLLVDFLPLATIDIQRARSQFIYRLLRRVCPNSDHVLCKREHFKKNKTTLFSTHTLWFHFDSFTCAVMRRWVKGQTRGLADTLEMNDHSDESPSVPLGATPLRLSALNKNNMASVCTVL